MFLFDLIAKLTKRAKYQGLLRSKYDLKKTQQKILLRILQENANTKIGREYNFSKIDTYTAFKSTLPIQNSDQYKERLQKVYNGYHNELVSQPPHFFAMTAGSTGDYKYIPINKRFKNDLEKSVYAFYYLIEQQCPEFSKQPIQFLVGSAEGGTSPGGIKQGFVSGFNYRNLPGFIRRKFIIPYWAFTLENAEDRYYAMARFLADSPDLVAVGAFSPVNISNIARVAIERIDNLIKDLEAGTLTLSKSYSQRPKQLKLKKNKLLAIKLINLKGSNKQLPEEKYQAFTGLVFPSIKYFATWMGGNMKFSLNQLEEYFGKKDTFEMPFSASEGIFGVPFQMNYSGGIAAVTSHFLEFIPESQFENDNPEALSAWEIEKGQHYYLVVTTSGGLYRYSMEDLVFVKDYWGDIPVLEFISKRKRQISISNERINENDVTNAVVQALEEQHASVAEFVLMPTQQMSYKLLVEDFQGELQQFANNVESNLRKIAMGYDFEREDLLLKPLSCAIVKQGTLKDYVNGIQFRSNLPSAQFKPVHLANDFELHQAFPLETEVFAANENISSIKTAPYANTPEEIA